LTAADDKGHSTAFSDSLGTVAEKKSLGK